MKAVLKTEKLTDSLQKVTGIIEKAHTIKILSNVLIRSENKEITLIGTDCDIQIVVKIFSEQNEPGELTVPAKKFLDICRFLPKSSFLELEEKKQKLEIRSGNGDFELRVLPSADFPFIKQAEFEHEFFMDSGKLKYAIEHTAFCMGLEDVRKFLNGLHFCFESRSMVITSSDGHRLARSEVDLEVNVKEKVEIIMPRKAVLELGRLLEEKVCQIRIQVSSKYFCAQWDDIVFTTKLMNCKAPNYNNIFPSSRNNVIKIGVKDFTESLKRVAILSNEINHGVMVTIEGKIMSLNSHNIDHEQASESVDMEYNGARIVTGFNSSYILDALKKISSEFVLIDVENEKGYMVLVGLDQNLDKFIIVPMRI